jgi:CBS domain-containing protein
MKTKHRILSNISLSSRLALALGLVIWSPVQARSAEPAKGKMMVAGKMTGQEGRSASPSDVQAAALNGAGHRVDRPDRMDRRASDVQLEEIMPPSSAWCHAGEPVEEALRRLHEHRATSLPVVDEAGGCCGTVSIHSCVTTEENPTRGRGARQ